MVTTERCLHEIGKLRGVAQGVDAAYVARSRLGRLTLTLAQVIAERAGSRMPNRPGPIAVSNDAPEITRQLAESCNRLLDTSKSLCQPSEPLDERWRSGWSTLLKELDELEMRLRDAENANKLF